MCVRVTVPGECPQSYQNTTDNKNLVIGELEMRSILGVRLCHFWKDVVFTRHGVSGVVQACVTYRHSVSDVPREEKEDYTLG